jgi:hypothetical protein
MAIIGERGLAKKMGKLGPHFFGDPAEGGGNRAACPTLDIFGGVFYGQKCQGMPNP